MGGIVLSESVTTKGTDTDLITGTGSLTIVASKSLSTTHQLLVVTADDIDLQTNAHVSSGSAMSSIFCTTTDHAIGMGTQQSTTSHMQGGQLQELFISGTELQYISLTGMTIGGPVCALVTVDGITATHNSDIGGIVTLIAW